MQTKEFCVYLTIYSGETALPPFYIGSKDVCSVNLGYRGSVSSTEYKALWCRELRENPQNFTTVILSRHKTRKEAFDEEARLHHEYHVMESELFVNMCTADGRYSMLDKSHSAETKEKMRKSREKFLSSVDRDKWYEDVAKRMSATKKAKKQSMTKEQLAAQRKKLSDAQNNRSGDVKSKHHQNIVTGWAKRSAEQQADFKLKRSQIAKAQMSKLTEDERRIHTAAMNVKMACPHCNKTGSKGNMSRWHFDNCKSK